MILTDGVHLTSDSSTEELHLFARKIGLKYCWFHYSRHMHYDIPKKMRSLIAKWEVEAVTTRQLVKRCVRPMRLRVMKGRSS